MEDFSKILEILKLNLQEEEYPFFSDEQLKLLYETNDKSISKTCWRCCLLKATTDDKIKVGPIEIKSSSSDYWHTLADIFKNDYEEELKNKGDNSGNFFILQREDGQ